MLYGLLLSCGSLAARSRGGPQWWCLLDNQTRDFVADFLIVAKGSLAALRAADLKGVAYSVIKPATSSRIF